MSTTPNTFPLRNKQSEVEKLTGTVLAHELERLPLVAQRVPLLMVDVGVLDHGEEVLQLVARPLLAQQHAAVVVALAQVLVPHTDDQQNFLTKNFFFKPKFFYQKFFF